VPVRWSMELERALFRIHQRSIESEELGALRLRVGRVLPAAFVVLACCLVCAHGRYVGRSRCLPEALRRAGLWNSTSDTPTLPEESLGEASIGAVDKKLVEKWAENRPGGGEDAVAAILEGRPPDTSAAIPAPLPGATKGQEKTLASYTFVFDRELLGFQPHLLKSHSFKVHNVTLTEACLDGGTSGLDLGVGYAIAHLFEGFDGFVVNELACTFRSRGYLVRLVGADGSKGDLWAWGAEEAEGTGGFGLAELSRKLVLLAKSCVSFALLSATTGSFIRVAVNASAVLLFAMAAAFPQMATAQGGCVPSVRMLMRVFPWIGVHIGILRGAGRPLGPLLKARLAFLMVQTVMYLCCSLMWRVACWRLTPEGYTDQVFGLYSAVELFNMVFVRTPESAAVFPKLAGACLVYLHFYNLSSLFPCHWLVLTTCSVACLWAAIYCVNAFEALALSGDPFIPATPTVAHPRGVYAPQLSPAWTLEAAPLWTMFWPVDPPTAFPPDAMRHISDQEYLGA